MPGVTDLGHPDARDSVRALTVFPCLAGDGPVSAKMGSGLSRFSDSAILVLLMSSVCDTLEMMSAMKLLHDPGSNMAFGYMAYCFSQNFDWLQCKTTFFPYDWAMGEVSDGLLCSASSTGRSTARGERMRDQIVVDSFVIIVSVVLIAF